MDPSGFWIYLSKLKLPAGTLPDHVTDVSTDTVNCYYPAMMCVNKQVRDEYTTIAMPRMMIQANWTADKLGIAIMEVRSSIRLPPEDLPREILSRVKILDLITSEHDPYAHPAFSTAVPLIDAIPLIMPQLSSVTFITRTHFSATVRKRWYSIFMQRHIFSYPTGLYYIDQWKREMRTSLTSLVDKLPFLTAKAKFIISCRLYSPHRTTTQGPPNQASRIPSATFAVCKGPDKDTFEIERVNLKFMGVDGDLISDDNNTQITRSGKNVVGR